MRKLFISLLISTLFYSGAYAWADAPKTNIILELGLFGADFKQEPMNRDSAILENIDPSEVWIKESSKLRAYYGEDYVGVAPTNGPEHDSFEFWTVRGAYKGSPFFIFALSSEGYTTRAWLPYASVFVITSVGLFFLLLKKLKAFGS